MSLRNIITKVSLVGHYFLAFVFVFTQILNSLVNPPRVLAAHSRVNMFTADPFAVLAGSAISDTGTTTVIGNVGLDPTGGASITGLTCSEITGTIYDNNAGYSGGGGGSTACLVTDPALLTQAKVDLVTAYTDAAGRSTTSTIATDLAGVTLTDGTYDSASGTFEITGGGTLTLDGGGNADSVFIFKMATTLVTSTSSRVVLTNGAQACNVYWQVGSSATLGTTSTLIGNVLALTSITDDGGSTINGRLLARNGAVTLNNTTLTRQTCAAGTAGGPSLPGSTTLASQATAPQYVCPTITPGITAPLIISSSRVDSDSVSLSWGPYSGTDQFNVRYGFTEGEWLYNVDVTGFSTTLDSLPANQPIWVQVAARNECQIGEYGEAMLVGGTARGGFIPRLPNTGFESKENRGYWFLLAGLFLGVSSILVSVHRKR